MLETMGQLAREQLAGEANDAEAEATRARHAEVLRGARRGRGLGPGRNNRRGSPAWSASARTSTPRSSSPSPPATPTRRCRARAPTCGATGSSAARPDRGPGAGQRRARAARAGRLAGARARAAAAPGALAGEQGDFAAARERCYGGAGRVAGDRRPRRRRPRRRQPRQPGAVRRRPRRGGAPLRRGRWTFMRETRRRLGTQPDAAEPRRSRTTALGDRERALRAAAREHRARRAAWPTRCTSPPRCARWPASSCAPAAIRARRDRAAARVPGDPARRRPAAGASRRRWRRSPPWPSRRPGARLLGAAEATRAAVGAIRQPDEDAWVDARDRAAARRSG